MYRRPDMAKLLRLRVPSDNDPPPAVMRDIQDSPGWYEKIHKTRFSAEPRNIVLSLCSDGVNPWKGSTYSMLPVMLIILNLPPHKRHHPSNMLLVGVIPGPTKPKSHAAYLNPLVDELLQLESAGVSAYDGYSKEKFILHARLLITVSDYPGHGDITEQATSGYQACHKCKIDGGRDEENIRMVYMQHGTPAAPRTHA
jgi:hypothetical protein